MTYKVAYSNLRVKLTYSVFVFLKHVLLFIMMNVVKEKRFF